jgi:hypothetical protein
MVTLDSYSSLKARGSPVRIRSMRFSSCTECLKWVCNYIKGNLIEMKMTQTSIQSRRWKRFCCSDECSSGTHSTLSKTSSVELMKWQGRLAKGDKGSLPVGQLLRYANQGNKVGARIYAKGLPLWGFSSRDEGSWESMVISRLLERTYRANLAV